MKRDLRNYAKRTNIQLAVGAFVLLFIIGLGLIWLLYGKGAALIGFLCLLGALVPIAYFAGIIWHGLDCKACEFQMMPN